MGGPKSRGRPCYPGEVLWRAEFSFAGTRTNLYWLKGAAAQHPGEGKGAELFISSSFLTLPSNLTFFRVKNFERSKPNLGWSEFFVSWSSWWYSSYASLTRNIPV